MNLSTVRSLRLLFALGCVPVLGAAAPGQSTVTPGSAQVSGTPQPPGASLTPTPLPALPGQAVQQNQQDQTVPPGASRDLRPVHPAIAGPQAPVTIPRSYALVIGIAHYENLPASAQLQYPGRDAQSIYTTLISPTGGQFPPENVHVLINSEATLANMHRELEQWLPSVTKPGDRVLIYFAGHGFLLNGKGYLAPYDLDPHNITATAYPMDTLGRDINAEIKGKWKVLMTDACHSGAIMPEGTPTQVNRGLLDGDNSLFLLTASRDRGESFESSQWGGGHGIFTYYVVEGMDGAADTNGDGIVTADELAEYVHENVRRATNGLQSPTSERGSYDPNMILAYNPSLRKATAVSTPQFGALVFESNMNNTEVYLDGLDVGTVNIGKPLRMPGLAPGNHTVKAVHMGYEPDGPREEMVYPGQETPVPLHILIIRHRSQAAIDLLDKGVQDYRKGYEANYKKAEEEFQKAVALDPTYSTAYMYLGRVQNALYDDDAALASFQKAIAIDPDYYEARTSYAGALLDEGSLDEAVRQLNEVTQHEPGNAVAWYLLSQAYARKGAFPECKAAAQQAVSTAPALGEGHFWLAECERHLDEPALAETQYQRYLELTSFDSGAAGQVNYYVAGYLLGMGEKKRAAEADIWKEQHGTAELGLCQCEEKQNHLAAAVPLCRKALDLMPKDMWASYDLAVLYMEQSNQQPSPELLAQARNLFQQVAAGYPGTEAADRATTYVSRINTALASVPH